MTLFYFIFTPALLIHFNQTLVHLPRKPRLFAEVWTRNQTLMRTKKVNYNPPDNLSLVSIEVNSGVIRTWMQMDQDWLQRQEVNYNAEFWVNTI